MTDLSFTNLIAGLLVSFVVSLPLFALVGLASLQYFYHAYESTPDQLDRFLARQAFPFSIYRAGYVQQMFNAFQTARAWYVARTALLVIVFWTTFGWAVFTLAQPNTPLADWLILGAFFLIYLIMSAILLGFGRGLVEA
ncbi:MAG: hypothetical protein KJ065_13415 [Anaerolineae bacterium]|nr:hypothetical protein [Anaerolineae bacterium]